jgi:hypothetical protein
MGMEKRKHYWNGRWGRIARHDVLLYEDGGAFMVEHRRGGTEGRSAWTEHADEDSALDRVRDLLTGSDDWREL